MSAPETDTGKRHAFFICITASGSRPSPHCRYFTGTARGGGGALSNAFANSPRNRSSQNPDGFATTAATSSCNRDGSPVPRVRRDGENFWCSNKKRQTNGFENQDLTDAVSLFIAIVRDGSSPG